MAKASQVVLSENEFYLIKAPNGKVLEVRTSTRRTALRSVCGTTQVIRGSSGNSWMQAKDAGASRTVLPAK